MLREGDLQLQQVGPHHPRIKQVLAIQNNTAPNRRRLLIAEGIWANQVALRAKVELECFLYCPDAAYSLEAKELACQLAQCATHAYQISLKTLTRISERDKPDGLLSIAALPEWDLGSIPMSESALVLVADGVEIPGNLGTLIRTIDACRADCLFLTNRRTRLTHPKVFRGSHGANLWVPAIEFPEVPDAAAWLLAHDFQILLAETAARSTYRDFHYAGRTAFVVGSERFGISPAWQRYALPTVKVPMLGRGDSLNVAISASILLYEARAQQDHWGK